MKPHLILLMAVLLCAGCVQRREVSPWVKLRPVEATDLALHLDVDRGERIFKVTLEYRGTETVREDYLALMRSAPPADRTGTGQPETGNSKSLPPDVGSYG